MINKEEPSVLALIGKEIVSCFRKLRPTEDNTVVVSENFPSALEYETERFNLWAENLGLHHHGHSSLDYQLREADKLATFIRSLLEDLRSSLLDRTMPLL